jgi:tetratricopeptide (TPR) repeat protein
MAFKDRGNILRSLGKYQAAIDDYGTALKLNPATGSRLKILSDRASCYDKVGQHDLAEKDRKQASPGSHEILNDLMK